MKYYAVLSIRRDLVQDTGEMFLLALIDEENLCRGLHLIGQERKIHELQKEIDELEVKQARLLAKLAEIEKK
jgi:hypothetical protein